MVNKALRGLVFIIIIIGLINPISATFDKGNLSHLIETSYSTNEGIRGWINLSFTNQPADSILESSFGEKISLISLIKKVPNSNFNYACSPIKCASNYLADNEEISKIFNLEGDKSVLFGFKILNKKDISSIASFSFDLTSDNSETEIFPLSIDVLNDGKEEWRAYAPSNSPNNLGSDNLGCFRQESVNQEGSDSVYVTSANQLCEKITLSETPEIRIGAYVIGTGSANFEMSIRKSEDKESSKKTCSAAPSAGNERVECAVPNFQISKRGDYFVCIKRSDSGTNKYSIDYESIDPCGFSGTYKNTYDYDFEIFARPKKYAASISIVLNNIELKRAKSSETNPITSLEPYIKSYLLKEHNNDCSKGCVIPVKIYSGIDQQISISNVFIEYIAGIFSGETKNVYKISETSALITASKFQKLHLDDSFNISKEIGNRTFFIKLDNEKLFSEKIFIQKGLTIQALTPTKTAVKYPTRFSVIVGSIGNITKYNWNFGDGTSTQTTANSASHNYNTTGNYKLAITVTSINKEDYSKEFNIEVGPASEIVPTILKEKESDFKNINNQTSSFSQFEKESINNFLNLEEMKENLAVLNSSAQNAGSEQKYEQILEALLKMKAPKLIAKTSAIDESLFYPEENKIEPSILKSIGGGSYETGKEEGYKDAIYAWNTENTEITLAFSEISFVFEEGEGSSLKVFDVSITNGGDDAYLIVKDMENILFKEDYSEKKKEGYVYMNLKEPEKNIVFSTTEEVSFIDLPMFISPEISKLTLAEWSPFEEEGGLKKWIIFSVIVLFIVLVAGVFWAVLHFWYKKRYEEYLFKDRNNLYNLVSYIETEKRKGVSEKDIAKNLKKAGWTSEQLTYALKKHAGKKIGMIGMSKRNNTPLRKIFFVISLLLLKYL